MGFITEASSSPQIPDTADLEDVGFVVLFPVFHSRCINSSSQISVFLHSKSMQPRLHRSKASDLLTNISKTRNKTRIRGNDSKYKLAKNGRCCRDRGRKFKLTVKRIEREMTQCGGLLHLAARSD